MVRALSPVRLAVVLVAATAAASVAVAADGGADSSRKSTNSFTLLVTAAAPAAPVVVRSPGAGIAPKAVVSNPYHVPLIQNAGSLRAGR